MKKKINAAVFAIILLLAFLPQYSSLGMGVALQQPETAWVVWETGAPIQRLAWDGSAVWAGAYKGGLSQWQLETGQIASYTSANGLSGEHVTGIAVDGSNKKWLALLDGSLHNTVDGSTFSNLTPAGAAGQNAWDVIANGSDIWLASLGGGVSRYSNGTWTTYNTANSALPHNDIYAVAVVNSSIPWVGTVNYGVAALQNGDWVSYTVPVQIEHPISGTPVTNQAVTDITVDPAGNKWFATDGSGVAVLDASNTNWSVYNTSNSGLGSDFIHRTYIDPQGNYWFGTLNGGVSRLSADRTSWLSYNASNSPLPENDVLDVTTDSQGGLWLAAYDSGLAYYGSLPASAPTFEFDLFQKPDYRPGNVKGYYLWVDPATYEWTLAWAGDGSDHSFTGEILADSSLMYLRDAGLEAGDSAVVDGNSLTINASENNGEDSVTFKPSLATTELTIRLKIDGAYYPYNIHLGELSAMPGTAPFNIPAVQPVPPAVTVPESMTVDEGDYVILTGELDDPDSPTGHTTVWNLGDGTLVEDQLVVDHVYPDNGVFTAQLTVTDIHDRIGTGLLNITVQNVAPDVDFYYYPFVVHPAEEVTFTGYFFDPGTLDTHTITWDFGDGTAPLTTPELTVPHTYEQTGLFTVGLTVTDDDGGVGSATFDIQVVNDSPQFELGEDVAIDEGAQFARSVAFTDPDSTQWELVVDYGDGTEPANATLNAGGNFDLDHVYADNGLYTLTVSLTDDAEAMTTDEITVTVQNVAPEVTPNATDSAIEGTQFVRTMSIADPGADTWTATMNYGDGSPDEVLSLTDPNFQLDHTYADQGVHTITIHVTDDDEGEANASSFVTVSNAAPLVTAGDDQTIDVGSIVSVNAAYTDLGLADTHTATINWGDGNTEPVTPTVTGPGAGSVAGQHAYASAGNFTVEVCVSDADGGTGCDTLIINASQSPTNNPPVVELGSDDTLNEGSQFTRLVPFTDPDSTQWQLMIDYGDGSSPTTATLTAEGNVNLDYIYADNGVYSVSVILTDDEEAQASDSITVTVANVVPAVNAGDDQTADVSESISLNATYSDAGTSDTHTATIDWGDGNVEPGTVAATGGGAGQVTGQHAYAGSGTYEVEVCVLDDDSGAGCDTLTVFVGGGFPSTAVLDNFNRADGAIGSNWSGNKSRYAISSNQLLVTSNGDADIFWNAGPFGADQEAYVTFADVKETAMEQDLLLKAQSGSNWGEGVIEVLYNAPNHLVQVWTYEWPQEWVQHGVDIPVAFADGDTFGARALADGTVEVYKNGNLLASRDITSWSYYANGGYIGLWFIQGQNARLDGFGGGNVLPPIGNDTPTLDEFNRANGVIGSSWSGAASSYSISSNQLQVGSVTYGSEIYWNSTAFGADQEAYFTFSQVHATATAQGLVLKAQSSTGWGSGLLEVLYVAPLKAVQVFTYTPSQGFVQRGADIPVVFSNGDQFSARAYANGVVEVYKNGILFGQVNVSAWPNYDDGGYLGMSFIGASGARLDDFGGGTLEGGESLMGMLEGFSENGLLLEGPALSEVEGDSLEAGAGLEVEKDSFDLELSNADIFWQGVPLGSELKAIVTFAQLNETGARQKPLSNGVWGDGVVQVLYDVPTGRIQIWMYDPENGWVQSGKDIRVKFVDGDVFSVQAHANGIVEIYRNGKPLAKRDVTP